MSSSQPPNIIIIGGGFAGVSAARVFFKHGSKVAVTLLDKKATSDFLPLLPDTIGRGINPGFLQYPLAALSKKLGFAFLNEEVVSVSLAPKEVVTSLARYLYDYLVIASGSETNFYGNSNIRDNAYKVDGASDVVRFIQGVKERKPEVFIIGGGGYTGIEMATNLRVLLDKNNRKGSIIIVERAPSILGPLPEWMKQFVGKNLKKLDIEVLVNSGIEKIEGGRVSVGKERIFERAVVVWAAGVRTAGFIQNLPVEKNPQGRIKADEFLRVDPCCFVAGDASYFSFQNSFLRMSIQFAITQGLCAAGNIMRSIHGVPLQPFVPRDPGYIVPMANNKSCGVVLGMDLKGRVPTFLHFFMCIYRSCGIRNKTGIIRGLLTGEGTMIDAGILVLRLGLGFMFFAHGLQIALGRLGGPGVNGFAGFLSKLGFLHPVAWAYVAGYTVLIGGLMVMFGVAVRIASVFLLIFITTAAVSVHLSKGFFITAGGFEYNFIIACACVTLILAGPGKFSVVKKL